MLQSVTSGAAGGWGAQETIARAIKIPVSALREINAKGWCEAGCSFLLGSSLSSAFTP